MQLNIILAGVGGQGILSIAVVLDRAAAARGWRFKQAEVHGMSQRGGEVQSHLRISDAPIHSELVPKGAAHLVLSVEPLEALRYLDFLRPEGALVTGSDPFENLPSYPPLERVLEAVASRPNHVVIPGERLAREAGSAKAQNIVLLGAAADAMGFTAEELERAILETFAAKGERIQKVNVAAFRAGQAAAASYRSCLAAGIPSRAALALIGRLRQAALQDDAVPVWRRVLEGPLATEVVSALEGPGLERVSGTAAVPLGLVPQMTPGDLKAALFR